MAGETRSKHKVDNGAMAKKALPYQLSHEHSPFNNLKCLRQTDRIPRMPTKVKNYLHESSPCTTFLMDLPQKRTRQEVDKGPVAKKLGEEKQPQETMAEEKRSRQEVDRGTLMKKDCSRRMPTQIGNYFLENSSTLPQVHHKRLREEVDNGTMAKKALSCTDQLPHQPSSFNNFNCLNQVNRIPRTPIEVKNQLHMSSPCATLNMDLPLVPHKRSRHEADNGTMPNTLDKEKQQTKIVDEERRMLEAKISMQDRLIAEKKVMLETMKVQHEKRMLEAKIHAQDKIIAQQKLLHEIATLEEKMHMQNKVIEEQKAMLEIMKLQNEKKMFEATIQRQDKIIAQQKAMLEALKLQHEATETERGDIDN